MTYTILFIHAHLSPLELSNFITVFSVRSNWNFGRTLRAIRLPILRQLQSKRGRFYKEIGDFGLDRDWEELYFHKQASASFQKLLIFPWKYNFAWKVRKCSNRDAVTYECGYQSLLNFTDQYEAVADKSWWVTYLFLVSFFRRSLDMYAGTG